MNSQHTKGASGVPFQAGDIAVQPGHPGTIAVSRVFGNSGARSGLAIFDDSTMRQNTTGTDRPPGIGGTSGALWNSDGSRIFSFEGGAALQSWSFCTYVNHVTSIGVVVADCVQYAGVAAPFGTLYNGPAGCGANCDVQINGGRIYSASGVVYDTQANVVVGAYRTAGQSIAVDPDSNKVHFASSVPGSGLMFETFNLSRMALSERNNITEDVGLVRKLVRWGPFGLAAITDGNKLVLTSGTFVSDAAATGISLDGMSLQDGASNIGQHQYRTLAIQANQLAWNAGQHVLYASIQGSDPKYGNSVVAIDINAGAVVSAVPVGSEPSWLSLSDDSAKLWIAHGDTSTVVRVSTDSMSKDLEVPIFGYNPVPPDPSSPGFANALAVQPGANSTVAIAAKPANGQWAQTVVVDNSVTRPQTFPFYISSIAWGSPSLLYACSGSLATWHFYSLQASLTGLTLITDDPPAVAGTGFGSEDGLQYAGGLLYDNLGIAYSPVSMTLVRGIGAGQVHHDPLFIVDPTRDRAYMTGTNLADTTVLDVYQLSTLALIDSVEFPATVGLPKSLTTLGTQGVAVSTADGHVVLVTGGML